MANDKKIVLIASINEMQAEMEKEFESLIQYEDTLLRNFIRGKITAYDEMIELIKIQL